MVALTCGACGTNPVAEVGPLDPHFLNKNGSTHLMAAAFRGDIAVMEDLLARGAEMDLADQDGQTALHQAVIGGRAESVAFLLEHKASVNLVDHEGFSPLMYAASRSGLMALDYLISAKPDASLQDPRGWAALMFAVSRGDPKILGRLLAYDSKMVNVPAKDGRRPLDLAVEDRNLPVARLLIQSQANPLAGAPGRSALELATRAKLPEMSRLLCEGLSSKRESILAAKLCQPR